MYSSIARSTCVVLAHLLALMFTRYTVLLVVVVQLCGDRSTSFIASHVLYPDVGDATAIVVGAVHNTLPFVSVVLQARTRFTLAFCIVATRTVV